MKAPQSVQQVAAPAPSPADFREAMRRLVASVMLITSRDEEGNPHGMAASSVISVSMDPPSMLVAINRTAGLYPVVSRTGRFCVNLLSSQQEHLLAPFSQTALRGERFKSPDWHDAWSADAEQLPWLANALAALDCTVEQVCDYGTHSLFIGRVTGVHLCAGQAEPLVWFEGARASLVPRVSAAA